MYQIAKKPYGFHLTFSGHISADEMQQWCDEFCPLVDELASPFCVFVDMREIKIVPPDAQPALRDAQSYARAHGMLRSVVILSDDVIRMQFRKIARQTGIIEWERYIDASHDADWEQLGMAWIIDGVDPDPEYSTGPTPIVKSCQATTSGSS